MDGCAPVCCPVCSADTENERAELPGTDPEHVETGSPVNVGTERGGMLAALAMIAELPLTPAERAEVVRRLLGEHGTEPQA